MDGALIFGIGYAVFIGVGVLIVHVNRNKDKY